MVLIKERSINLYPSLLAVSYDAILLLLFNWRHFPTFMDLIVNAGHFEILLYFVYPSLSNFTQRVGFSNVFVLFIKWNNMTILLYWKVAIVAISLWRQDSIIDDAALFGLYQSFVSSLTTRGLNRLIQDSGPTCLFIFLPYSILNNKSLCKRF